MANKNWDQQQNRERPGYGNDRGTGYSRNDENSYTQRIGREQTDWQGNYNRDTQGEGSHRGKGPRGYERSQDRIREDVCERLTDDAMIDASEMDVRVENNEVVLSGVVHNREEKRRAEDLAEAVAGVRNVENRLRVEPRGGSDTNYYREYDEQGRIRRGS